MATRPGNQLLQVTVNYEGSRVVLHLPRDMKVGRAIEKAAADLKVSPKGLTFLYHGTEVTDDMTVNDALRQANTSTVIHLIKASSKKSTTARIIPAVAERETVFGFCRTCEALSPAREIFLCPDCRHRGLFMRASAEPINHFASRIEPAILRGSCSNCNKDDLQAHIQFECVACSDTRREIVGVLRQVRDNTNRGIPCMKCGSAGEEVFRFACSSRHCMCLDCFPKWCQQQMNAHKFKIFEGMGFSVGCPGPGVDCPQTAIPDPHHFQLVDDDCAFYKKFKDLAIENFQPPGDNVFCQKCKVIVDTGKSSEVEVTEPEGVAPVVSGLRWYHKLLGTRPEQPQPRRRRRTSCSRCNLHYCVQCKQVWHEGNCIQVDQALQQEEQAFPIDPDKAKASCWPQNED